MTRRRRSHHSLWAVLANDFIPRWHAHGPFSTGRYPIYKSAELRDNNVRSFSNACPQRTDKTDETAPGNALVIKNIDSRVGYRPGP